MAISPILFNATVQRAQDVTTVKQNEDNKGMVDQGNFQTQMQKEADNRLKQVHHPEDTQKKEKSTDANSKGGGMYSGDGGRNRKKKDAKETEKVVVKGSSSFDVSI